MPFNGPELFDLNYFSSTEYYIDKEQHSNQNISTNKFKGRS